MNLKGLPMIFHPINMNGGKLVRGEHTLEIGWIHIYNKVYGELEKRFHCVLRSIKQDIMLEAIY